MDYNRLNRVTFDCFVSENSTRILLNVLMGGKLPTKYFLNLNLGEKELLKVCEIYSLKKWHYTKMLFFRKFWGCFLPDFHFLNLVETWNKSRGKFIQKNICDNDKDIPTTGYIIITPTVKVLENFSELFFLKPTHGHRFSMECLSEGY